MKKLWLLGLLLAFHTQAQADDTIVVCGQNEISIVDKTFTGGMGEKKYIGRYMFVFGPLVQELQGKNLYPTQMVPGSNTAAFIGMKPPNMQIGPTALLCGWPTSQGPFSITI